MLMYIERNVVLNVLKLTYEYMYT